MDDMKDYFQITQKTKKSYHFPVPASPEPFPIDQERLCLRMRKLSIAILSRDFVLIP